MTDIKPTLRRAIYNAIPDKADRAIVIYPEQVSGGEATAVLLYGMSRKDAALYLIAAGSSMLEEASRAELSPVAANETEH